VKARDLIPGNAYKITLQDCCIEGVIDEAVFMRREYELGESEEGDHYYANLVFRGFTLTNYDQCIFEEVEKSEVFEITKTEVMKTVNRFKDKQNRIELLEKKCKESEAYIAHQNTEIEILCADLRKAKEAIENL
jgi:hypothetical protein